MKAALPDHQRDRLKSLYDFGILDTARERTYDDIAEFAAALCETPIAVVNFIDADRQWFKAEIGLGCSELPLDDSICSHAILELDFLEIQDTFKDSRTSDNPLCLAEGGLRFYAGALIKTKDGLPLGTVCVLHTQPHQLNDVQKAGLRLLANKVMQELELRAQIEQLGLLRREMDHRVKNSLQSIASMVRVYARALDERGQDVLRAIKRRIDATALVHQELHEATEANAVPMLQFLTRLSRLMEDTLPEGVTFDVTSEAFIRSPEEATAIAVILTEFVANSVKHGFANGKEGEITANVYLKETGQIGFEAQDNGWGTAAPDRPEDAADGLGMRIVAAAANMLGGKIDTETTSSGHRIALIYVPVLSEALQQDVRALISVK